MSRASEASSPEPLPEHIGLTRRSWLVPFVTAGVACVIGGGLLAAVTAYVTTEKTAWATAYIVLVAGVAQVAIGLAVSWLAPVASRRLALVAFIGWNLGNAGVIIGQLAGLLIVTDVGSALLVITLILILIAVRNRNAFVGAAGAGSPNSAHTGILYVFRGLVTLLAISIPVGVVLAYLGH